MCFCVACVVLWRLCVVVFRIPLTTITRFPSRCTSRRMLSSRWSQASIRSRVSAPAGVGSQHCKHDNNNSNNNNNSHNNSNNNNSSIATINNILTAQQHTAARSQHTHTHTHTHTQSYCDAADSDDEGVGGAPVPKEGVGELGVETELSVEAQD